MFAAFRVLAQKWRANQGLSIKVWQLFVSAITYGVLIVFLDDYERGILASLLYVSYLAVSVFFLGQNTMLAHWSRGPYEDRLRRAIRMSTVGFGAGGLIVTSSMLPAIDGDIAQYLLPLGVLVSLGALSEALFSAKISSIPRSTPWQHYAYGILVVSLLLISALNGQRAALQLFLCFVIANLVFLFAKWPWRSLFHRSPKKFGEGTWRIALPFFLDSFSSSMRLRLVAISAATFYSPELVGRYLVLWLAFEVLDQLIRFHFLTGIHAERHSSSGNTGKSRAEKYLRVGLTGAPAIILVGVGSYFMGLHFTSTPPIAIAFAVISLALSYLIRMFTQLELNLKRAQGALTQVAAISTFDIVVAILAGLLLTGIVGFPGLAHGLLLGSLVTFFAVRLMSRIGEGGGRS